MAAKCWPPAITPVDEQEHTMSITDARHAFTAADEARHAAVADPWWQESVALHWFDHRHGIGGMHRIGHEPGQGDGGQIVHHHGVFDASHRFRHNRAMPLGGQRSDAWFGDATATWSVDGAARFALSTPDVELDLRYEDLYALTDFFPRGSANLTDEFAAHHYESSSRVVGTARIGDATYDIDGFGHRDHSWGVRRWDGALSVHRWVSGVIDTDLAFGSIAWLGPEGPLVQGGYVVRDGNVRIADAADVVVWLEADGVTHRGGELRLTFGDEDLHFVCHALDGWVNEHHGVTWIDELCAVEHDGRIGYADFEVSHNARMGSAPVRLFLRAGNHDGLEPRAKS
jgi:hypothetical protein